MRIVMNIFKKILFKQQNFKKLFKLQLLETWVIPWDFPIKMSILSNWSCQELNISNKNITYYLLKVKKKNHLNRNNV